MDIRLHNTSQLAGYAKRDDLEFICELFDIGYEHVPELAPSEEVITGFKQGKNWAQYKAQFLQLLEQRNTKQLWESRFQQFARVCLLCSEHEPKRCHRRIVAEYLEEYLPNITVQHLF